MRDENTKRGRGRPSKPAPERKSGHLTFRTRADLRDKLAKAAAKSGRSISEEIEHRLIRSFEAEIQRKQLAEMVEEVTARVLESKKMEERLRKLLLGSRESEQARSGVKEDY